MARVTAGVLLVAVGIAAVVGVTAATTAQPDAATADVVMPSNDTNGLTETELATLWSRDSDEYVPEDTYRELQDDERTHMQQLANGTDITFTRPPDTAATWTRNDFTDLEPGGANASVYPPHAELEEGPVVADAHATIFAVQPSTRGHLTSTADVLYIAPDGQLRAFIDYRVRTANDIADSNHEITEVRLKKDGEVIARVDGTHTPVFDYQLEDAGRTTLTVEADIRVQRGQPTALTVSDTINVEVYNLTAHPQYASYPNGDRGVAIFQNQPWQGYTLTENETPRVRGVWRFYTARDSNWETMVRSTRTDTTRAESDALPVYVHAYPSRIGPRAEPAGVGPELLDVWGINRSSPSETIGENINIEVTTESYTTSYGVAVRAEKIDRDALRVGGIVRGVNATVTQPADQSTQEIRPSRLSVETVAQNASQTTLRLTLQDAVTGDPIRLMEPDRKELVDQDQRDGYITIAGKRVRTDASGTAVVTLDQPGVYTATYHPGSWLGHDPAYTGTTETIRWHPLLTPTGWMAFLVEVGWQLMPFLVAFYAAHRVLAMLSPTTTFRRNR